MGKAGRSLKQVLEAHGISQNKLAVAMNLPRSNIGRWVHEDRDPSAENVVEIVEALRKINAEAAEEFIKLYLGGSLQGEEDPGE
ncbi:helix-turn-helix transcriptional regulator [Leptolyngbya sp. FACHB-261]|uniref:helix-turn-helix domain-containing protein n=1 Tax=Leptolyngbya sp. FACHB-261 TaxID=2692806 RepID=UPI0016860221|nr:helix-turn-helix transcriptional regulator [Leptolyngbya sp. FACHB-261]MBD2099499.1 helix-turn-helix transcriptional regulator [Leptolyngbya sp. FACHB-261]